MRIRNVMLVVVAVISLGACNRERSSVTGSYGDGVVSGSVVVSGMDNNTPAGVEVAVRGTGMSTVLAADGRFAFAGVPTGAELVFRRGDGIDSSLAVQNNSRNLVVELTRNGAHGRRRGVGGAEHLTETIGVVNTATADQLVVTTADATDVTIAMTPETVIRQGHQVLTAADLLPGTAVEVKSRTVDGVLTAVVVHVEGADDGEAQTEFEGTVVTAAADQLVILDSHRVQDTFVLTAATVVRKGNTPVDPATLLPGDRVHVRATSDGVTLTASLVIVQNTNHGGEHQDRVTIQGTVTAVGASDLTVDTRNGSVTVQVTDATRIQKNDQTIALGDIVVGDKVNAKGTRVDASTIAATQIEVESEEGGDEGDQEVKLSGAVTAVGADSITVETADGSVTVQVTATTKIQKNDASATLADIAVGDQVKVEGTRVDATTVSAAEIEVE